MYWCIALIPNNNGNEVNAKWLSLERFTLATETFFANCTHKELVAVMRGKNGSKYVSKCTSNLINITIFHYLK